MDLMYPEVNTVIGSVVFDIDSIMFSVMLTASLLATLALKFPEHPWETPTQRHDFHKYVKNKIK